MKFRSILNLSRGFRTNMYCFIFAIFCCLQSFTHCVNIQPKQTEKAIKTSEQAFFTCSRDDNETDGTLKWINPDGYEVEDNPQSPVFITREDRSQKTGIRLFFINVTKKDAGEYKCQFVKDNRVTSTSIKIHVLKSIDIEGNKDTFVGVEGDTFTITCSAKFDPLGQNTLTWHYNNVRIDNDSHFSTGLSRKESMTQLTLRNNLVIKNLTKENEGLYICKALSMNPHTTDMKDIEINVRVQFKPHFAPKTLGDVWVSDNTENNPIIVNITCFVNADPVADFVWMTGDRLRIENGKLSQKAKISSIENLSVLTLEYSSINELRHYANSDPFGNMRKFICQASNSLGSDQKIYELKVGKLPDSPIINDYVYNKGLLSFTLNESEIDPPIDIYCVEIANKQSIYFNATNKNPVNNTYEIELDIPKGQHKMIVYAHNPVGWSQPPNDSIYLAVISRAFLAQQYLAFVMIGCTIALANLF